VRASTNQIRALIRSLSRAADEAGSTLEEAVFQLSISRLEDVSKGKVLIGTSSGGTGVQFSLPPLDGLQAGDIVEACERIRTQIDQLKADGVTEEQMEGKLLESFSAPAVAIRSNFGGLRL
jgi:methyl-accepting chemotaxis protein